ncbi:hypothetical protein CPC08DRAFT_729341 [Agrocybe pediades]|nr:hypothetical protein CPC08DRAFT_729341 [Agrocybe pediades]
MTEQALRDIRLIYGTATSLTEELSNAARLVGDSALVFLEAEAIRFGFPSAAVLLGILATTNSFISGSLALAAIHPNTFSPHDIDFYVSERNEAMLVACLQVFGYHEIPTPVPDYLPPKPSIIMHVSTYARHVVPDATPTTINIICRNSRFHCLNSITGFHSTLVMNMITWYGIVCLYPKWTIAKQGLIVIDTPKTRRCFAKYEGRGYTFLQHDLDYVRSLPRRSINGNGVLFVPFTLEGVPTVFTPKLGKFRWLLANTAYRSPKIVDSDPK